MKKRVIESLIIGIILVLISKGIDKYGGLVTGEIYKTFIADLWWMWLGIVGFAIYFLNDYIWDRYKEFKKEIMELSELKKSIRQAIIKSEMLEEQPIIKWLTFHSSNYKQQKFSSLEEKINYLTRIQIEYLEERIKNGIVKDETK
jgi:hypothetical protein